MNLEKVQFRIQLATENLTEYSHLYSNVQFKVQLVTEKETEIYADQRLISTTVASGKDKNLKGRMPQPKPLEIKTVVPFMS